MNIKKCAKNKIPAIAKFQIYIINLDMKYVLIVAVGSLRSSREEGVL